MRTIGPVVFVVVLSLAVMSCFPGGGHSTPDDRAGFFTGIWHGWIAPVSLIVGIFKDGIRVYEPNNSGWWYDAGFYIAVIAGFGGISLVRRRTQKKSE